MSALLVLHQSEQSLFVFLLLMQTDARRKMWMRVRMKWKRQKMLCRSDAGRKVVHGGVLVHSDVRMMNRPRSRHRYTRSVMVFLSLPFLITKIPHSHH